MRDTDIHNLSIELDRSSNRLTNGMIIAALLVSGSLVINVGDKIFLGLPLISLLCFGAATVLGLVILIQMVKK